MKLFSWGDLLFCRCAAPPLLFVGLICGLLFAQEAVLHSCFSGHRLPQTDQCAMHGHFAPSGNKQFRPLHEVFSSDISKLSASVNFNMHPIERNLAAQNMQFKVWDIYIPPSLAFAASNNKRIIKQCLVVFCGRTELDRDIQTNISGAGRNSYTFTEDFAALNHLTYVSGQGNANGLARKVANQPETQRPRYWLNCQFVNCCFHEKDNNPSAWVVNWNLNLVL